LVVICVTRSIDKGYAGAHRLFSIFISFLLVLHVLLLSFVSLAQRLCGSAQGFPIIFLSLFCFQGFFYYHLCFLLNGQRLCRGTGFGLIFLSFFFVVMFFFGSFMSFAPWAKAVQERSGFFRFFSCFPFFICVALSMRQGFAMGAQGFCFF